MNTKAYVKVKYYNEVCYKKYYIGAICSIGFLLTVWLISGLIRKTFMLNSTEIIELTICLLVVLYLVYIGYTKQQKCNKHIEEHKYIMEHGTKRIGKIIDIKAHPYKRHYKKANGKNDTYTSRWFSFTISYIDESNNEKIIDTTEVINSYSRFINKDCVLYEYEGKVIADSIDMIDFI